MSESMGMLWRFGPLWAIALAIVSSSKGSAPPTSSSEGIRVADGFQIEHIYTVPRSDYGSWVCLTVDSDGSLLTGDQYGGLFRISVPPRGAATPVNVTRLDVALPVSGIQQNPGTRAPVTVGAHGLARVDDKLYVMSNERPGERGIWEISAPFEQSGGSNIRSVLALRGAGEHGPHALVPSRDGRTLIFASGNQTDLPDRLSARRTPSSQADQLLAPLPGARGNEVFGGYVGHFNPVSPHEAELYAVGFRNHYDLAVDSHGEIFTFDSDPERDLGAPWYEPTRILHVVSGADFGWRAGTGRLPDYLPDTLPATLEIGPGSPTGLTFGTGALFPEKYQRALFAADWSFGTLYAIHLESNGASFRASHEEFVVGQPLPITDIAVNPKDGALYFITGGRQTQSALYRISYIGDEATTPAGTRDQTPLAHERQRIESWHRPDAPAEAIEVIWPLLAHNDRFLRHAARTALEHQPFERWRGRMEGEADPHRFAEAVLGLVRTTPPERINDLLRPLTRLSVADVDERARLTLVRAWQVALSRGLRPPAHLVSSLRSDAEDVYPASTTALTRELATLLVALDSRVVVGRTLPLLVAKSQPKSSSPPLEELAARNERYGALLRLFASAPPDTDQIALVHILRHAQSGWAPELRNEFFSWFGRAGSWQGGHALKASLRAMRDEALAQVPDETQRAQIAALAEPTANPAIESAAIPPRGPGHVYTVESALHAIRTLPGERDLARGRGLFNAAGCLACHTFRGSGTGIGPDLTGSGRRYTSRDFLESIVEPSRVISDQYSHERITRSDGTLIIGRVVAEENNTLMVATNPFTPEVLERVRIHEVISRQPSPTSWMPPGLLNDFSPEEVADLVAYVLSGDASSVVEPTATSSEPQAFP